ncbi:hypothetical protein A5653_02375 [Mycobacterium colombiense]|uniref:sensor domain-containing protein n=1 Tax=Mycobacterium colombiense TaxID=339268 RepID=UPI0007EF1F9B|nr:sensor domain-containing protein [Mycobacterium colombiense]OBK66687.1 hypothetical protein A5653_02375 [Mycobacterium colombiense]
MAYTNSSWRAAALITTAMMIAGCAVTVDGAAHPTPGVAPRSISGQTVTRVLLGKTALSRIAKQPLRIDPRYPPIFGGPDALAGGKAPWPNDCNGVAMMLQHSAYRDSNVKDVARTTWQPDTDSTAITQVEEGVVSLATAADAQALFMKFSRQWQRCEGKTVPVASGPIKLNVKVDNVQTAASVTAATMSIDLDSPNPRVEDGLPAQRAIGVRDNCLLEVEVDFGNNANPSPQQPGEVNTTALDIAQVMRDKVNALS